jgi:L-serine deaminase
MIGRNWRIAYPVTGTIQMPCIARSGRPALDLGDPDGPDMNERYKETGQGGLAVNVVEC